VRRGKPKKRQSHGGRGLYQRKAPVDNLVPEHEVDAGMGADLQQKVDDYSRRPVEQPESLPGPPHGDERSWEVNKLMQFATT
jgi:hypothetical protein